MPGIWLDRLARKGGVVKLIPFLNWEFDLGLCHFGAASNLALLPAEACQMRLESKGDLISGGVKGFLVVRPQACPEC